MNLLGYEFTEVQRQTLDRYTDFLGSLRPIFNHIPVVFERRRRGGHQPAVLAADSRLNNASFNGQYLSALWRSVNEIKALFSQHRETLAIYTHEALDITAQTSRREPVAHVDFRLFSISRSERWLLAPPEKVEDLTHEFHLRFINVRTAIRQLDFKFTELYQESYGLSAVFMRALDHRSCLCHTHPTVVQALFQEAVTTPVWRLAYSSRDASVMANEYKADIAWLFKAFGNLNAQMGLLAKDLYQRLDDVVLELRRATYVSRLGELNSNLSVIMKALDQSLALLSDFEAWLRK